MSSLFFCLHFVKFLFSFFQKRVMHHIIIWIFTTRHIVLQNNAQVHVRMIANIPHRNRIKKQIHFQDELQKSGSNSWNDQIRSYEYMLSESRKFTNTSEEKTTLRGSGANFSSTPIQPDRSSSLALAGSLFDPSNLVENADLNFSSLART